MPHGYCLIWNPLLLASHVIGDFIIFVSYMIIPAGIYYFSKKRPDLRISNIYVLFYAFILLCGVTHLISIIVLWKPIYGIEGILKLTTGAVSLFTAISIWKLMPYLVKIPSFKQLEDKNTEIEQFAYTASHDLREPIRNISTYIAFLKEDQQEKFDKEGEKYLQHIESSIERMNSMITELLTYSRLGHNTEFSKVDLNSTIGNILQDLNSQVKASKAVVTKDILPIIKGSKNQMHCLFQNLIDNAIKYKNPEHELQIRITATKDKNFHIIKVSDNGLGIDPINHDRIFNLFQRIEAGKKDDSVGSGIGLAHCKKIVALHDGEIEVKSNLNKGATFIIKLPTTI